MTEVYNKGNLGTLNDIDWDDNSILARKLQDSVNYGDIGVSCASEVVSTLHLELCISLCMCNSLLNNPLHAQHVVIKKIVFFTFIVYSLYIE